MHVSLPNQLLIVIIVSLSFLDIFVWDSVALDSSNDTLDKDEHLYT